MHGFQADMSDDLYESERELRGKHCRKLSRNTFGTVSSVAEAFALDYNEENTTWQTEYSHRFFVPPKLTPPVVIVNVHDNKTADDVPVVEEEDDDERKKEVPPLPVADGFNESELKTLKQTEISSSSSSRHLAKHHVAPTSDQELALEDSFRHSRGFLARTPSTVPYNRYETEHQAAFSPKRFDRRHGLPLYSNPSSVFNILEPDDTNVTEAFKEEDVTTMDAISAPERDLFMALYADEPPPTVSEDKPSTAKRQSNKTPTVSYTSSMLIAHVLDVASTIKSLPPLLPPPPPPPPSTPPKKERNFIQRFLSSAEKKQTKYVSSPSTEKRSPKFVSSPSSCNKRPSSDVKLPTDWSFKPHINQLVRMKSPTSNKVYKPIEATKRRLGGTAKTCYSAALHQKSINNILLEQAKKTIQSKVHTTNSTKDLKKKRTSGTAKTLGIAAQKNKLAKSMIPSKTTSKVRMESPPSIRVSISSDSYGFCMTDIKNTLISTVTNPGKTKLPIKREDFDFDGIVMDG